MAQSRWVCGGELQGGQEGSPSHLRGPHTAPLPRQLKRRQDTDRVFQDPQPTAGSRSHRWDWRGTAAGKASAEAGAHWPAPKPTPAPRIPQGGASWWGCSGAGSSQGPTRAWRTGASREAAEWTEMPGAPMLVSQQSNPQSVRACFVASTSGCSRSGGRESSRSPNNLCSLRDCPSRKRPGTNQVFLLECQALHPRKGGWGVVTEQQLNSWAWPCHRSAGGPQTSDFPSLSLSLIWERG